jgi:Fe-S-cluster containining protein
MKKEMRRSVTAKDISTFGKLDMIYNQVRVIEAKQNNTEYKCLGSGKCCKIGLRIPLAECANIAFKITQEFYLKMEDKGEQFANEWMESMIESLKEAMHDPNWEMNGETDRHCVFYKGGCTIYGYRPMVCRTFGTITPVDDYCPRIRNAHGQVDYYAGDGVARVIKQYQDILAEYASDKDATYNSVVYMPLGVLTFLLTSEELVDLAAETDQKFWEGVRGWYNYRLVFTKMHGYDYDTLHTFAEKDGDQLGFVKE